ncbi:TetR/AcrR family transcriptional regulator [Frondihabitans cladoniiphilus]|uniref:TetR/AcrR family transcriptional regulator n=1 Tax=Frondihabitans cladoniiphilus TaxID=715785 RepID=A0ABP8W9R5_9MICO
MTGKDAAPTTSRARWVEQIAALDAPAAAVRKRREPLTVSRIVEAALAIVEAEGFPGVTMRRVASALGATPGALYAHVRDKSELDDLMVGRLCARVELPEPNAAMWQEQILDVCRQLRDLYLQYPGISQAALQAAPRSLDTLRINEGLLAILIDIGVTPRTAGWATDALFLYIAAYSAVSLRRHSDGDEAAEAADREEVLERFLMLPESRFPNTVTHAAELTAGEGHDRFDFTVTMILGSVDPQH